jgi:hypothetical protein
MLPTDVLQKTIDALQSGDLETTAIYLAGDFVCKGMAPQPLDKAGFLKYMDAIFTAIPNWSYNVTEIEERGNFVRFRTHVRGRNTRPLNLHFIGVEPVPQKGIRVTLPEELMECTVKDNKLLSMRIIIKGYASSLDALLAQLGAGIPETVSV